ncbi:MAG TPA: hypothetical protein VL084_11660 [Thermoanaerobaculia bacterium]|nr:hypothetical protein [Thermoanaerobaculia bacterium]
MSRGRPGALFWPAAAGLALVGALIAHDAGRLNSATMDEPFHALAGAEYAISGTYFANLEHPPLAKLLAGVSLRLAGARAPRIPRPFSMRTAEQPRPWAFSGDPLAPDDLFAAARRPFYGLFFLLVVVVAAAVRHWGDDLAGLSAAALIAFEPTHLGHAAVVHTDVATSLGFFGTIALALLAIEKRSFPLWAATGAVLGATLATKFSAVLLVPVVAAIALAAALSDRRTARREGRAPDGRPLRGLLVSGALAAAVLLGCYAAAMRSMSRDDAESAVRIYLGSRAVPAATVERIAALSRGLPPAGHYAAGLAGVEAQNRTGGGVNYLRGRLSTDGFWDYFFVAFGVKSSVGLLAILLLGLAALLSGRVRLDLTISALLFPALYLFASGMATSYNIGIRHMLPAVPLLVASAVLVVVRAVTPRAAAAILLLGATAQAAEVFRVHPHEISFFNVLAGGPEEGAAWLNDSNLDWGQDLRRLQATLRERGEEASTTVAYFGGAEPAAVVPRSRLFDPARPDVPPGLYAVSSFLLCCGPETLRLHGDAAAAAGLARLRRAVLERGEPVGRVGYSIQLFRFSGGKEPAR